MRPQNVGPGTRLVPVNHRRAHPGTALRVVLAERLRHLVQIAVQPFQRGMTRVNPVRTSCREQPRTSTRRASSVVARATRSRRRGSSGARSPLVSRARREPGRWRDTSCARSSPGRGVHRQATNQPRSYRFRSLSTCARLTSSVPARRSAETRCPIPRPAPEPPPGPPPRAPRAKPATDRGHCAPDVPCPGESTHRGTHCAAAPEHVHNPVPSRHHRPKHPGHPPERPLPLDVSATVQPSCTPHSGPTVTVRRGTYGGRSLRRSFTQVIYGAGRQES